MNSDLHDFKQFMQQREEVARAYVRGDAAPLDRIAAHADPATFFSPQGGFRQGADAVSSTYAHDATSFAPGGDSTFEILHMAANDGIAYWVGFQRATAYMRGMEQAIPFNLRVTEVFRREDGQWKLIHRHADSLTSEPTEKNK